MVSSQVVTKNAQETGELGERLGRSLKKGVVIALYGELGSGKTTFVQGLARGIGIKKRIISPTFVMVRQYPITNFFHVDLYRINTIEEIKNLGLEELWEDPQNIVAIEWAEKAKNILPLKRIEVFFAHRDKNKRKIRINVPSQLFKQNSQ